MTDQFNIKLNIIYNVIYLDISLKASSDGKEKIGIHLTRKSNHVYLFRHCSGPEIEAIFVCRHRSHQQILVCHNQHSANNQPQPVQQQPISDPLLQQELETEQHQQMQKEEHLQVQQQQQLQLQQKQLMPQQNETLKNMNMNEFQAPLGVNQASFILTNCGVAPQNSMNIIPTSQVSMGPLQQQQQL
ncbi:hypothetical protein TKK_0013954 [Trichogramma kaykai]